jgi:hypothetical protein
VSSVVKTPPPLALEHLHAYAAWLAHGPGTCHHVSGKSDLPLLSLRPRTEELHALGALQQVGQATEGPLYAVAPSPDINAPSATDHAQRQLNTLPVQDQVSIAAGIMARHGRRGRAVAHRDRQQVELL